MWISDFCYDNVPVIFLSQVSYVKGMDWYLMVCFTIIFLSLLECIVVDRLWRANARKIEDEQKNRRTMNSGDKEPRKVKNNRGGGLSFVNEFLIFAEFVRYSNVVYSTEI